MSFLDERDDHLEPQAPAQSDRVEVRLDVSRAELRALQSIAERAFEGALSVHQLTAAVRLFDATQEVE